MITIQPETMLNQLEKGKSLSIKSGSNTLVSITKQVSVSDPLVFFEASSSLFTGKRTYWSDPDNNLVLVGLGAIYSIRTGEMNRYKTAEKEWNDILKNSLFNKETKINGTGPLLIGGFSFDSLKPKTELWKEFGDTMLILPEFMLTFTNGITYLTINALVSKDTDIIEKANTLYQTESTLLSLNNDFSITFSANNNYEINEVEPERFKKTITKMTGQIREQVLHKVVLARELKLHSKQQFSPYETLFRLREEQPNSYLFAIENENNCFLGASPERLVKCSGNEVLSTCLAGSIGRGNTIEEDERLGKSLLNDKKNLHEHALVVDMISEAMKNGCEQIEVPSKPKLLKLRNIQHLYTPVKGIAKKNFSLLRFVESLHPTPALGGFPQKKAIEKIREEELLDRGWYAGPVGWIDADGNGEFAVAIRSGLLQGKKASLFAGCGIVEDSDPESEYQETVIKFKPMLSALRGG